MTMTIIAPVEKIEENVLPKSRAYINAMKPSKLRRLIHHLQHGRLVMMESCNCLLGFEGEYNTEARKVIAVEAESETFWFPNGNSETPETNQERSRYLLRIALDALERKERRRGKRHAS